MPRLVEPTPVELLQTLQYDIERELRYGLTVPPNPAARYVTEWLQRLLTILIDERNRNEQAR